MKLIEALKNLKTIEKRIVANNEKISEYAAYISVETPPFETQEKQTAQVASMVQANLDLVTEYHKLKRAIEFTNLNTEVTIGTRTCSISELNTIRGTKNRNGTGFMTGSTYQALNPTRAITRMQQNFRGGVNPVEPPKVIVCFKEEDRIKAVNAWNDFVSQIDGRLEVVNATTELTMYE